MLQVLAHYKRLHDYDLLKYQLLQKNCLFHLLHHSTAFASALVLIHHPVIL